MHVCITCPPAYIHTYIHNTAQQIPNQTEGRIRVSKQLNSLNLTEYDFGFYILLFLPNCLIHLSIGWDDLLYLLHTYLPNQPYHTIIDTLNKNLFHTYPSQNSNQYTNPHSPIKNGRILVQHSPLPSAILFHLVNIHNILLRKVSLKQYTQPKRPIERSSSQTITQTPRTFWRLRI